MDDKGPAILEEGTFADGSMMVEHKSHTDSIFGDLDPNNTHAVKSDDSDGQTEWSLKKLIAALSLGGLFVAGSIPTLLIGSSLQYIAPDLDAKFVAWLITANTLTVAATTPFVGHLTDVFGNKSPKASMIFPDKPV